MSPTEHILKQAIIKEIIGSIKKGGVELILKSPHLCSLVVGAIYKELGQNTFNACNVPSKEDILNATKSLPLDWNGADSFIYNEQV